MSYVDMIVQVVSAFFAILAFTYMINVPKGFRRYCGIEGAVGWLVYLLFLESWGTVMANFFGTMAIALLAHMFARIMKAPVTVFLIPGILILVPGGGLFRAAYQLFLGTWEMAKNYLMSAVQIAGMIALAVFIVDSVFNIVNKKMADLAEERREKEAEERAKL